MVYLQLDSVFHQLIGGVVARLCRARGALLATDLHSLLPKKKPGVRGVSLGKSVDQGLTFLLSKKLSMHDPGNTCSLCIKLAVFANHHST